MNRIVRYFEFDESGERTGRQLIIKDHTPKPPPADGAQWRLDPDFNAGDELLEPFPFAVNRRDSQWAANKILWSSQAEETGNGVFERFTSSSDPGC
jgi:hypothetical protein